VIEKELLSNLPSMFEGFTSCSFSNPQSRQQGLSVVLEVRRWATELGTSLNRLG